MHFGILRRLRHAVRRRRPRKMKNRRFLLHDNAPAHRSVLVKDFLATNNVSTLQHPPYLAPANFYLFPRPIWALDGQRSGDTTDSIKNATEELKRLSQNGFQECFQHLYSQQCIDARRVLFWRKCCCSDCTVFITQKQSSARNILKKTRTSVHIGRVLGYVLRLRERNLIRKMEGELHIIKCYRDNIHANRKYNPYEWNKCTNTSHINGTSALIHPIWMEQVH